jgi:hypothetical protein
MRTRLPGGSLLAGARQTRELLDRGLPRAGRRATVTAEVEGSVTSERDIRPILRPSARAARAAGLVSYGDPIPTDPEAILAHWIAWGELRAQHRALLYRRED